ncbi:hypothetical protein SUGI_0574730 [Cryptomeria japonica]|nr:hypothetical protein SUGI_0574730 [Cryptomeria japonica]
MSGFFSTCVEVQISTAMAQAQTVVITHVESGKNLAVDSKNFDVVTLLPRNDANPFQQWIKFRTDNGYPLKRIGKDGTLSKNQLGADPYFFINVGSGVILSADENSPDNREGETSKVVKVDTNQFKWALHPAKDLYGVSRWRICPFHYYNFKFPLHLKLDGLSNTVELGNYENNNTMVWDITPVPSIYGPKL